MAQQRNAYNQAIESRYDDAITGAKWWSRFYMHTVWGVDYTRTGAHLMAWLPKDAHGLLLDVPVGTLVFTHEHYAKNPNLQVVGVDYSQEMLDIAGHRVAHYALDNVKLLQGDVGCLPFEDESFDYVLTMNGLQVFPDKPRALEEMARVLRVGGVCYGSLYTRGVRWHVDWLVTSILNRLGLMAGPHFTRGSIQESLRDVFRGDVDMEYYGCVALFRAQKEK